MLTGEKLGGDTFSAARRKDALSMGCDSKKKKKPDDGKTAGGRRENKNKEETTLSVPQHGWRDCERADGGKQLRLWEKKL